MHELLTQALQGVDPSSPGAFWQIFGNLMAMMPWWWLFWSNVISVVGAAAIAHFRGTSLGRAVGWALVLGPFGWLITWYAQPESRVCPRCEAAAPLGRKRCTHCGCALNTDAPPNVSP